MSDDNDNAEESSTLAKLKALAESINASTSELPEISELEGQLPDLAELDSQLPASDPISTDENLNLAGISASMSAGSSIPPSLGGTDSESDWQGLAGFEAGLESTELSDSEEEQHYLHLVRIGDWLFVLPDGLEVALHEKLKLSPLPFAPLCCRGLVNYRGGIIAVYDLALFLSAANPPSNTAYWLIVGQEGKRAAIMVDEISTLRTSANAVTEIPGEQDELHHVGVVSAWQQQEQQRFRHLNIEALLDQMSRQTSASSETPSSH